MTTAEESSPDGTVIEDEPLPLGSVPKTGEQQSQAVLILFLLTFAAAMAGYEVYNFRRRKSGRA
jgi:hypothetical protein